MATLSRNTIFTNVALTLRDGLPEGVWWEGMTDTPPTDVAIFDWRGEPWTPRHRQTRRALPTAASTRAPPRSVPSIDPDWEAPEGVPIAAFVFGGRRPTTLPLVYQAFNWVAGVYTGANHGLGDHRRRCRPLSGRSRRDPMAMLPFCGYNMGDYFRHWIRMGRGLRNTPQIFHVNWFRKDADGNFLWPGFGENLRVLNWIVDRVRGRVPARETPIGWVPFYDDLCWNGLDFSRRSFETLETVDAEAWKDEAMGHERLFIPAPQPPAAGDGLRARAADLPAVMFSCDARPAGVTEDRSLQFAKDRLQEGCYLRRRIRANLFLLFTHHREKSIHRLIQHIGVNVEGRRLAERQPGSRLHERAELFSDARVCHRPLDDGPEGV